jgi:hypothetical protein
MANHERRDVKRPQMRTDTPDGRETPPEQDLGSRQHRHGALSQTPKRQVH